jgi:hypothetical protein
MDQQDPNILANNDELNVSDNRKYASLALKIEIERKCLEGAENMISQLKDPRALDLAREEFNESQRVSHHLKIILQRLDYLHKERDKLTLPQSSDPSLAMLNILEDKPPIVRSRSASSIELPTSSPLPRMFDAVMVSLGMRSRSGSFSASSGSARNSLVINGSSLSLMGEGKSAVTQFGMNYFVDDRLFDG